VDELFFIFGLGKQDQTLGHIFSYLYSHYPDEFHDLVEGGWESIKNHPSMKKDVNELGVGEIYPALFNLTHIENIGRRIG